MNEKKVKKISRKYFWIRTLFEIGIFLFVPIIQYVILIIWGIRLKMKNKFAGHLIICIGTFILILSIILGSLYLYANSLNAETPLAVVTASSMQHTIIDSNICDKHILDINKKNLEFEEWWNYCGNYYENNFNIDNNKFKSFNFLNGINIGDMLIIENVSSKNIQVGDVILFIPGDMKWYKTNGPVIHRVVNIRNDNGILYFQTKGDFNPKSFDMNNFETNITENNIKGRVKHIIPYLGYIKFINN